ncbi:sensor histidine kinase [Streptomyces sp. NPDC059861]|uniref:sensor histidine kinase n=1 Tax=Streptomyces sp. NPDC059861 TaxID=3346974 RepID=UPI0036569949
MSRPGRWWRSKSTPAKVETYTRWSFHFFPVVEVGLCGLPLFGGVGLPLAGWLFLLICGHAALCSLVSVWALDWVRGLRPQPLRMMGALGVFTAASVVLVLVVLDRRPADDDTATALGTLTAALLSFGVGALALGVRDRRRVVGLVLGFSAGTASTAVALGSPVSQALVTALAALFATGFLAFTSVFSVWLLNGVYELDAARETRARLAVAEERLRFGRDMHDVVGRNLAVIALKSELAVQLARRGRPEAVEQMIEVQRIAQDSQREVREVVRGYREADLGVELAGAQGVLTAAGIACEVSGEDTAAELPAEVQSALGWVVREATTNVLRHGNAERCVVGLRMLKGRVVLTVENDGVTAVAATSGGSGLAGLRERLAAVDGMLEAGPAGRGLFRLVAEVPLTPAVRVAS